MSPNVPPSDPGNAPNDRRRPAGGSASSGPARPTPPAGGGVPARPRPPVAGAEGPPGAEPVPVGYEPSPGGSPYGAPDPELTAFEDEARRWHTWLAVAAGVGLLLSIAALVLAISAGNRSASDDRIADAVKRESRNTANEIERQIRDETARAEEVLDELESSTKTAREASAAAESAAEENGAGVEKNAEELRTLRESVDSLSSKVDALPEGVPGLEELATSIDTINSQVQQLSQDVTSLQGSSGDATP